MALADARAIFPELSSATEQPEGDAAFLRALGRWSERYTPWIALDGEDGLALDISGSAHLFGGEAGLLEDMARRLQAMGLSARMGLADTKGAAWALARFSAQDTIAATARTDEAVMDFPVAALRIDADVAATLARLGLRMIRDIEGMPRGALARRFGTDLVLRLDQIFGRTAEPMQPTAFIAPYAVRLSLPEPIGKVADVRAALERLLLRLCARLERERRGARALRLSIRRSDGGGDSAEVRLARASSDPDRIALLFDRVIPELDAGFGIDVVRLLATETEELKPEQGDALDTGRHRDDALGDLIERTGNRIGFEKVTRFLPAESHIPERSFVVAAAAYSGPESFPDTGLPRPLILFPPERIRPGTASSPPGTFHWRGMFFGTLHAIGPERIAPEWWWDDPAWRSGPRDYWRIQTAQGRRLWLFRSHGDTGGWFAQGEFA